jgi:uncharacterized protein YjbJ (UPF0337 family)
LAALEAVLCGTDTELETLAALAGTRTISERGSSRNVKSKSNVQADFIGSQSENGWGCRWLYRDRTSGAGVFCKRDRWPSNSFELEEDSAMSGTSDKIKGRVKEAVGALTDDQRLKDEGRLDQTTGKIKDAVERVIDKAKNTVKRPATK